jgi:hypothetical protein
MREGWQVRPPMSEVRRLGEARGRRLVLEEILGLGDDRAWLTNATPCARARSSGSFATDG